ncbi:molybdopterin biosynthesis protein [Halocatena pleomorpha]|uniref:Molybdopterin biosynthesis protein n=1 Tax=Halocatena pleomorpha TaxID=1785090 RepID=A0A3P3RF88_9EURY|nr:molybdopterin biosynthesis protein [Halocatena pleomorpha]RRJ32187.1 molybdopterin biosynthesis protein [Halocatena pleomorpha]
MRKEFRELASPESVHETIESLDLTGDPKRVPLRAARGRVLAERLDAPIDVPGFDRASVDGYAVKARDTFGATETDPVELDRVGTIHAGTEPETEIESGECVAISTGAVLPAGADAVVMVERTDERDGRVELRTSAAPGKRVMAAGTDIAAGERALGPGTRLTTREIGLLSALGVSEVPVVGAPRVGIISTGEELVRPGKPLNSAAGQIYDVNSYTIAAGVEAAGGTVERYPHTGDDYEEMERVLRQAANECDLVVSSGSTSAGAVDVVYRVLEQEGELLVHGVAVKPGKPMLVGEFENAAYVGLPGYPVSALTIFDTFLAPAIRRAAGQPTPRTTTITGRMAHRERYSEGRLRLLPVGLVESGSDETRAVDTTASDDTVSEIGLDGELLVYPVDKGSGATTSLVEADGVVEMHPDTHEISTGERVEVSLFSPAVRPPSVFGVGEDDPAFSELLDRIDRPRYLGMGSQAGRRRLRNGVVDVAVITSGTVSTAASADEDDLESSLTAALGFEATLLGGWTREWGLVVPAGNPADVTGLADLVDRKLRFVNRTTDSGLRATLTNAIDALAAERSESPQACIDSIDGFEFAVRAHESPVQSVRDGTAAVGLGLRSTADRLDVGFVPVGTERVFVLAHPDRTDKDGVTALGAALSAAGVGINTDSTAASAITDADSFDDRPGYDRL